MTNSELNEFLGDFDYTNELVEKLETLQQTLEQAMQPITPKYKEDRSQRLKILLNMSMRDGDKDLNPHEKSILNALRWQKVVNAYELDWKPSNINGSNKLRFKLKDLEGPTGWSSTTIKRNVKSLIAKGDIQRDPHTNGYYNF